MYLDKFVHSKTGKIMMSIILGIGLATFFRTACKGRRCKIVSAPPFEELSGKIFMFNNNYYKLESNVISCSSNKKIVKFA